MDLSMLLSLFLSLLSFLLLHNFLSLLVSLFISCYHHYFFNIQVGKRSDIVCLSLPSEKITANVLYGPDGLFNSFQLDNISGIYFSFLFLFLFLCLFNTKWNILVCMLLFVLLNTFVSAFSFYLVLFFSLHSLFFYP